jgi:hypothetical protein
MNYIEFGRFATEEKLALRHKRASKILKKWDKEPSLIGRFTGYLTRCVRNMYIPTTPSAEKIRESVREHYKPFYISDEDREKVRIARLEDEMGSV